MSPEVYQNIRLESDRIITRRLTKDDVDKWMEFFSEKEAVQFFPDTGIKSNQERAVEWIDRQIDRYNKNTYGLQALIDKNTNELIGQCGLLLQVVDGQTELEVGYHILKKYWGQGLAPEAARLFIDYAFAHGLAESVISIIDKRNISSKKVAQKNGLELEKQTLWKNLEVEIFRITLNQWKMNEQSTPGDLGAPAPGY